VAGGGRGLRVVAPLFAARRLSVAFPYCLMQDYYETLQVHPRADAEAIRAAYERLRERYDPARLEDAADELQHLARRRRDEIERAFTVLGDPERRRAYDADLAERAAGAPQPAEADAVDPDDETLIDYRPLPPARREERPAGFNAQPTLTPARATRTGGRAAGNAGMPVWIAPTLIVAAATFGIVLITLVTTVMNAPATPASSGGPQVLDPNATAPAPTPDVAQVVNQFEGQITAARQVAERVPENANAWLELGNALYDSVIVVRERLAGGDQSLQSIYVERLPRWLEAADAYRKAVELTPADPVARADLAASLCYYGEGANDQGYVQEGLAEAERAVQDGPEAGRALLSHGLCLALSDPPQTAKALEQWQRLVVLPDADPGLVFQARQLIAEYGS
jgi:tetratricopeptide (TPR) repeat protein